MRAALSELLADAGSEGRALGAFTCYTLATAAGVLEAASEASTPVVLMVSVKSFGSAGGRGLMSGLRALADDAEVPVAVQLDHATDLDTIASALDAGADAVMADGSQLGEEENAAFVAEASRMAHARGASVEAELGRVEGDEDLATVARAGRLTDPTVVPRFLETSGADALAVSVGNAHGTYRHEPDLDWARLDALRAASTVPLTLHGASGLGPRIVSRAIGSGITKVNVNTELRRALLADVQRAIPRLSAAADVLGLVNVSMDSAHAAVRAMLPGLRAGDGHG